MTPFQVLEIALLGHGVSFLTAWCFFLKEQPKIKQKFKVTLKLAFREGVSKNEGLKNIGHSMSIVLDKKKSILGYQHQRKFHIWFIITFYYKMRQILLQNTTAILLQNATKVYYKMCQIFYYKT